MTDDVPAPADERIRRLEEARSAEKEQAHFYRVLAALAEGTKPELAGRFHDLHADEQHHLSRLTARILELGGRPADLIRPPSFEPTLDGWEARVREREHDEIDRYTVLLSHPWDAATRELLTEIREVETHHMEALGGKWMLA